MCFTTELSNCRLTWLWRVSGWHTLLLFSALSFHSNCAGENVEPINESCRVKMKRVLFLLLMSVLFLQVSLSGDDTPVAPPDGNFRWAFGEMLGNDFRPNARNKKYDLTPFLSEGDIRLYFMPFPNSYMYLFSISGDCEFKLIYPDDFGDFKKADYNYTCHPFLKNDLCPLVSEKTRAETYMLVSTERLSDFEQLIAGYRKASNTEKKAYFSDIRMYIESLRSRRFASGTVSRPWDNFTLPPSYKEIVEGVEIELRAEEYKYFFKVCFSYAGK
jgi:hypothetical protein